MKQPQGHETAVIFDFDGVIADSIPAGFENFKISHPGVTREMYNSLSHKQPYHDGLARIAHLRVDEDTEAKEQRLRAYTENKKYTRIFEGIPELIEELSTKHLLAINTSAREENSLPILERNNLAHFFSCITMQETAPGKVARNALILETGEIDASRALFITDATGDVVDAHESGIASIGVTWGVHPREYFEDVRASGLVAIVDTVPELRHTIDTFFVELRL